MTAATVDFYHYCAVVCCLYCFQVKHPVHLEAWRGQHFQWDVLFQREEVSQPEILTYGLPRWAGTWKIMNFAFRQQKPQWDCIWPDYEQSVSDKFDIVQRLEEEVSASVTPWCLDCVRSFFCATSFSLSFCLQEELFGWENSWQLSDADFEVQEDDEDEEYDEDNDYNNDDDEDDYDNYDDYNDNDDEEALSAGSSATSMINEVFLPDWSDSCLLITPSLEPEEERNKIWSISFGYRQQIRSVHKITTITLMSKFLITISVEAIQTFIYILEK